MYYIAILAFSPVVNGGAAFVFAPGSMAAARAGAKAVPADVADTITAAGCRSVLPQLIRDGPHGDALAASKAVAQEVTFGTGDLLILDPFCTHAASTFREEVAKSTGLSGRYASPYEPPLWPPTLVTLRRHAQVLFSLVATRDSIGSTLAGQANRNYVAPASKYTDELREALPERLRGLLDWELPLEGALEVRSNGEAGAAMARVNAAAKL